MLRLLLSTVVLYSFLIFLPIYSDVIGSQNYAIEQRQINDFARLVFDMEGNLTLKQGSEQQITLEGDDNILPYITSRMVNSTLYIEEKSPGFFQSLKPSKPIDVFITAKHFNSIVFAGNGHLKTSGELQLKELELSLSGSSYATLELDIQTLMAKINGTGEYLLQGRAQKQDIVIDGTGYFNGKGLEGITAKVIISGNGLVFVNVSDNLDINISGSGEVFYMGSPKVAQVISGLGKVEAIPENN